IFNFVGSGATTGRGITDERAHAGGFLYIDNTTVEKNVQSNLFVGPTGGGVNVFVNNSRFLGSTANSGAAIRGGSKASITKSSFSGNLNFGIVVEADTAGTFAAIDSCVITNNGTGVVTTTNSPTAQIANNLISGNGTGVQNFSGTLRSTNNRIDGNTTNVSGILSGYNVQ
ncbi:MAG TPA: right-handed parallel beta-helix repeat-containing protein, partial [Pyrinomonadaceae bacterium]